MTTFIGIIGTLLIIVVTAVIAGLLSACAWWLFLLGWHFIY